MIPRTPPGEVMDSDDEEAWDVPHGHDQPMTPGSPSPSDLYSQISPESEPMSMGHIQALTVSNEDEDLKPVADLISTREDMV